MADAFRFERQNSPEISEPEDLEGMEFREKENLRKSSFWKSSPTTPSHGDLRLSCTQLKDDPRTPSTQKVTTEGYDESAIIAKTEKEESPQKIAFVQSGQDENFTNLLGQGEDEAGLELIVLPQSCSATISASSSSRVSPGTRITAVNTSKEFHDPDGSPESILRLSRIESAKQDMKNLKSATLGRMGKMFKIRPPTPAEREKTTGQIEQGVEASTTTEQHYGQDPTRKEKTHSLGRVLRLVDKDGAPRKLFSHNRTGSLNRHKKIHSTVDNVVNGSEESRNIFSRMLNQFRGRTPGATNAEPNLQSANDGPPNSPKPSLGTRLLMSLSARGNSTAGATVGTDVAEASVERVAVEYTA